MKQNFGKMFTRTVCMILCICMLTTTLSSCAFWDAIVSIFTPGDSGDNNPDNSSGGNNSEGNNPGGNTPGGDTPGGDTETTYYKVSFAVAIEEYKNRVTLPEAKLYKEGTEIQYLPTPAVRDMLFMGWYYDAAMTMPVSLTDKVNSDLMLYAKVVDTSDDISVVEGVYYHTVYDVDTDYTFSVQADSIAAVEANLSIINISSAGAALVLGEDYTVKSNGDGSFKVVVAYKAGKTYRANIVANSGLNYVVDGVALSQQVTTLNVLVIKEEVSNLKLADGLIYIPKADVVMLQDTPNGLVSISNGGASINSGDVGYFAYDGASLKSGDKVAIYEGDIPSERDFGTDNGAVKYLTVTGVENNGVYKFRVSDSKEVLFIPDIIPVSGKTNIEREAKIAVDSLDFNNDLYKQLGMDEDTTIDIGDYIAFFDGPMADGTPVEYVRITSVTRDNKYYYIKYTSVSYDEVIASMDIYHTRTNTPELSDTRIEEIKQQVYNEAMSSGFIEEAADYLVNLYISTNGLETMPDGTEVRYSPKMRANARSGGSGLYYEITKCEAEPDIKVGEGVLEHFEESNGIRVELTLSFEIEFTIGEDGENKVVISAEAVFEEEVLLSINVDGGAVWETAWIFPYIADYEMNANIDIGTYTGVSVIAKVYTNNGEEKEEEEDDDDSFFPDFDLDNIGKGDSYAEKAKNIGEELKKLFELNDNIKEEIEGEEEDDTGNDITEKYAEMMKEANETWIEIVKVEIYEHSQNLDQFGILWFSIGIDFVVSAQLYIIAGIEVETGVAKRYNFSVTLFERSVKTDVIDLEKAHFSFKFYCMGTAGLKVGFEVELSLALLSSDVASVGISAELGVSLGIWGYFYYSYEKEAGEEPEIQKAGAMFFELGIYIEVKFKAHLFNIEKLTYNPTLYENLWPLYSVGTQENVFEFEDYEDSELVFVMQGDNSIVLPDYIFRMKYLDLKDGKYYSGKEDDDETPSKTFDDETESRFLIEISDDRFTYNPKTNTLSTTVNVKDMDVKDSFEVKIQITYKHGALAFNQEVITREITVEVKNNANYGYIYVSLNGPATLNAEGPGGNSSYPVRDGEPFTVDMLPEYDVVKGYKFVKWIWLQNYRDVNGKLWQEGDEFVGLESVQKRTYLYLTAVWEPQSVDHTVRIFKEAVGGAYVYDKTETVTGLVGSRYELPNLADAGYSVRSGDSQRIYLEYNGSYDLYLERATKTIFFLDVDGEGGQIKTTAKAGSALVPPVVSSRLGYEFAGWAESSTGKTPCEMPDDVPFVDGNIVYRALWTPVTDVQYTVKHYVQNANDDGFELYMTEYFTAAYNDPVKASEHEINLQAYGYQWEYELNPGWNNIQRVALDGSLVIRVYYARMSYWLDGEGLFTSFGRYRYGQTVDLTSFENIPRKEGYRFVGWDADGDGIKDESFEMPHNRVVLTALWEGVDGTEYKVVHMVKDDDTDNYVQAGVTYMYGVTGTTPDAKTIYSDKYMVEGQFVAKYEKAKVSEITAPKSATMYAYYDRVEYNAVVKAYDPETGSLVKEISVVFPYGKPIDSKYLPDLSEFDVEGYSASRYSSSGYTEMPDHDIEIEVVYAAESKTPFVINHYKERTDGTYYLYSSNTYYGRTGLALHNAYRSYRIAELDGGKSHYNINTDLLEETYVARDGSTVFNIYYAREKVRLSGYIYQLDLDGNIVNTTRLDEWYRYGERVQLNGYFDNYEFEKMVNFNDDEVYYSSYFTVEENTVVHIYVKPKSGVPYTVTHWIENLDGTGYEVYATNSYTGSHSAKVLAESKVKSIFGFKVDTNLLEDIVLDGGSENNLNIYYARNEYTVSFVNSSKPDTNVSYQVKHEASIPTPPTDTEVPGYVFVEWNSYDEDGIVTRNLEFRAVYQIATNTPYKVNHYVMGIDGNYELMVSEDFTGSTNAKIEAVNHLHSNYTGGGYTLRENTGVTIAPDGSTVLNVYYQRESFRFSYHYYVGGKVVNSVGLMVMLGAATPTSIYDYIKDYPEYELGSYSMLVNGEYVAIDEIPAVMGSENVEIRVTLNAIGPEVTIIHKVMNTDGETYEEIRETFLAIPFEELDLADHLLASIREGFTYRIPVNNQIPDALTENVYEIYYDRNTYTVDYVSSYNFERITESYLYGQEIGTAPVFSRPGYTQAGWDATIPNTMPARNISFTTTWQIRESVPVTIVHMMTALDGDGYVEVSRQTISHTPELMIYGSNYATGIAGGTYKSADKKVVDIDGSTEVRVYYTRNEYTVRFTYGDIAGAGEDVVFVLPYGSAITAPDFDVPGYTLVGWSPELPTTVTAEHITYTAKWAAEAVDVTVQHWIPDLNGDQVISSTETVVVESDSTVNGEVYKKVFEGFTYSDADKNVVVKNDGTTVVNVYYTRNSYKVTYTYGEKIGDSVEHTVQYGAALPEAPVFTVIGYSFAGWDNTLASTMPASNLTYVATWTANTDTEFTVEHYYQNANDDGYTQVESETKYGTTDATINGANYTKALAEAIFERAENAVIAADGTTVIKIYYVRTSYKLTFTYGDKVGEGAEYTLRYGQSVSYNPSFSVVGYVFAGWDKEIPATMPAENLSIGALWTAGNVEYTVEHYVQNANDDDYTLNNTENRIGVTESVIDGATIATLVGNGIVLNNAESKTIAADGSTVIKIYYDRASYTVTYTYGTMAGEAVEHTVRYGATLPAAPVFSAVGYSFAGWDKEIAATMPASNLTYVATWTANTDTEFTVEHYYQNANDDGYTKVESEIKYGTTNATVNGADYKKALAEAIFERAESAVIAADGTTVIKIYYVRTTYTLTFTYGDKTGDSVEYTLRYGQNIAYNPSFSAVGYVFAGWDKEIPATMPGENITLNATWTAGDGVKYLVEHYVQNANNDQYVLDRTDNRTGVTGTLIDGTSLATLVGNGLVLKSAESKAIAADGSTVIKIYYDRASYTVTYTYGDKTGEAVEHTVRYGATLPEAPVFTVVGYTFAGWDKEIAATMPASNIAYAATWTANTDTRFTVEHYYQNANDDSYVKVETETKYGTTDATVNGADYKKALAEAIFERTESKTVNADGSTVIKVYYVRTSYTITFTYGDKVGESVEYTLRYGQSVSYNPSFSVEGFVFAAWDKEIPETMPAENITLNATWTAGNVQYTVEHYVQNADDNDYTLSYTDNRTGATGTVIDGTTLATLVGNGIILNNAESKAIAADGSTVIKIYYDRATYTVTYTYGTMAGEAVEYTVRYGAALPEAPDFTVVGYSFAGWDKAIAATMPASNLTYVATWTANTDTEFTVEHYYQNANDDGYTVIDGETLYGTTASVINGANFKRDFDEAVFERAESAVIAADGSTVIKVYYTRTCYNVIFSYGFVANDEEIYTVRYGATLPEAPVFSAAGYTFQGWLDEEGLFVDELAEEMPAYDIVYTALFMANEDTEFTVEHYIEQADGYGYDLVDTDVGTGRTDSMIDDYWQFVIYDDGTMYMFERFNSEELTINPDGSTVLKIYYQRVRYNVTFYVVDENVNFVEGVDSIVLEFKYGQTITPPSVEILEGYEFVGYDTFDEIMPEYEIEYYIIWRCMHDSIDGDHQCDRCWEPLECADNNDDGHCDYGREPMDPDDHRYLDNDNDHICDICCGSFTDLCFDNDKNGKCDVCDTETVCPVTGEEHVDEDENHKCDQCDVWMSNLCILGEYSDAHTCIVCTARFYELCCDEDHNCVCDGCYMMILCVDENGDNICDNCEQCIVHVDEDRNSMCEVCGQVTDCIEEGYSHYDGDYDHACDVCGVRLPYYCGDWDEDGVCDECHNPGPCQTEDGLRVHVDENNDHYCDTCFVWLLYVCVEQDEDGVGDCAICGNELKCIHHIDDDRNAFCDRCGEETTCEENLYDIWHEDYDYDHTCDWCGVWLSSYCYDDDYDGHCDECYREFVCNHVDEDEDNYCDRCYRIINCTHEYTTEHYCDECYQKVTDCYDDDGDLWCDECYNEMPCQHMGMDGEHICYYCYAYLSGCKDEDEDGECDLSGYFPHAPQ